MDSKPKAFDKAARSSFDSDKALTQYGVGSTRFAGAPDALYERHLKFDNVVEPETANARERYKAAARAVRDILSDRWLRTNETYARENPKRVYYVSIEFLIGRSLGNNVMNLMLDPDRRAEFRRRRPRMVGDPSRGARRRIGQWRPRPSGGLLPRLRWRRCSLPAMGYGLRYEHGIFQQKIRNGWQEERPDNWLRHPDPWEVVRPSRKRRGDVRLLVRIARGHAADDSEQPLDADRRPL